MEQISNWARCHIHPSSKEPTSSTAQHTHNRTNDNQERSLLAHATVRPVPTHVPCCAPHRAYTCNEPHVRTLNPHTPIAAKVSSVPAPHRAYTRNEPYVRTLNLHAPIVAKVSSDTICNALESKRLRSTLQAK
jgi:hypothetical protein